MKIFLVVWMLFLASTVRMTTEFPSTGNKRINYFNQKKEISRYSRTNIYSYRDCVAITYIIYARKSTYVI
jgi:hypothetical protein